VIADVCSRVRHLQDQNAIYLRGHAYHRLRRRQEGRELDGVLRFATPFGQGLNASCSFASAYSLALPSPQSKRYPEHQIILTISIRSGIDTGERINLASEVSHAATFFQARAQTTPSFFRISSSAASIPYSCSTSAVCSPYSGGRRLIVGLVSLILTAGPSKHSFPDVACSYGTS